MTDELLQELASLQRQTNNWLRVLAMPSLAEVLTRTLATPEARRVYDSSDGRTSRDVGAEAGVSHQTVISYWHKWAPLGVVEPVAPGRYARVVSLEDVRVTVERQGSSEPRKPIKSR